jgi:truncated hemoglobin YjbI
MYLVRKWPKADEGVVCQEELMATEGVPSLYERLGGVYSIATVMDDFIDRIMIDPRLNANPRVAEAHHRGSWLAARNQA